MNKKKVLFLVLLGIVVVLAGAVGVWIHRSSPSYSLKQVVIAFQEHDLTSFQKYVDAKSVVSKLTDEAIRQHEQEKGTNALARGMIALFREKIETLWTSQIEKLVETGTLDKQKDKEGLGDMWLRTDSSRFEGIKEVVKEGKVATVHLEFYQARFDTLLTLKVLMRDKGGYWQVFDLSDFTNYTKTLDALERKRVERINQLALTQFNAHVKLVDINVVSRPMSSFGDIFKENVFSVTLENTSQKEIDVLTYIFNFVHPSNGSRRGYIYKQVNLKPGERFVYQDVERYGSLLKDTGRYTVKVNIVGATFKDGSKIAFTSEWADKLSE